jgi:hypothetical protein
MAGKSAMKAKPKTRIRAKAKAKAKARPRSTATTRSLAPDWRQETLDRVRVLILEADPEIIEERKWRKPSNPAGVPVFSHDGIVCTGESYKNAVKLTFMNGARLPDPARLFNAGLGGNARRAIDIKEGEELDAAAFKALIKAAVAHNLTARK